MLRLRSLHLAASTLLLATISFSATAEPPLSIRNFAPASSAVVIGSDDFAGAWGRFQKTPLWGLWESEEFQEALKPAMAELEESMSEMATELGRPDDRLSAPASFGAAIFMRMDEELGLEREFVLGFIDWGDAAGSTELVEAMIDRAEKDNPMMSRTDLRDEVVRTIRFRDEDEEDMPDFGDPFGIDPMAAFTGFDAMHILRRGNRHLFASDLSVLEEMLLTLDGRPGGETIGGLDDFKDTIELLGEPDLYAMLLTANFQKLLAMGDGAFMLAMVQPMLTKAFGDIRAHALGVSVGRDGSMIDQRIATTVPGGKSGLLALIDADSAVEAPPAMVPADAISYGRFNVRFDAVMPTIREIVASLGEMEREQIEMMLAQMGPILENAFSALGSPVHVYSSVRHPIDFDSMETVIAIPSSDLTQIEPMVALMGPSMGLLRRDFQGQAIYSDEFAPMAIGLGHGHVFVGPAAAVEQALRGPAEGEREDAAMSRGLDSIAGRRVVGFGVSDLMASIEVQREMMKELDPLEEMEIGLDGEDGGLPDFDLGEIDLDRLLDPALWRRFVGPAVWDFSSVDRGFVMSNRLLAPPAE